MRRGRGLFHVTKSSDQSRSDQRHLVDFLGIAATGQVIDGRIQTLENGAVGLIATQALGNLVAELPALMLGKIKVLA